MGHARELNSFFLAKPSPQPPSMGVTHKEREGTGFPRNPIGVVFVRFSTSSKNVQTPLRSRT
jgi:hypothetical protein